MVATGAARKPTAAALDIVYSNWCLLR